MMAGEQCPWCGNPTCSSPCAAGTAEAARLAERSLVYGRVRQLLTPEPPVTAPRDPGRVLVLAGVLGAALVGALRYGSADILPVVGWGLVGVVLVGLLARAGNGIVLQPVHHWRRWLQTRQAHLLELGLELPSGAVVVVRLWSRQLRRDQVWVAVGQLVAVAGRRVPDPSTAVLEATTLYIRDRQQAYLVGSIYGRRPWPASLVGTALVLLAAGCWVLCA